eukprot:gnl/MRDRNA2_/MRDRNA2_109517_c0_seq1.p1 gnl/MRDRNA2_/MRDRNA2_109517_c0~~gnl/MRDRNA2_/MRDRNA2_109517_c0_seq1.p1  ORF type:complete len:412 (+),score=58.60 gnl/MRDRNA2_/MRDRNA2_109517_c0_seq1:74-1309(+)
MRSAVVIVQLAFAAQVQGRKDAVDVLLDNLVDSLFDRGMMTWPLHSVNVEGTTLAKPGALTFQQPASAARSSLAAAHAAPAARIVPFGLGPGRAGIGPRLLPKPVGPLSPQPVGKMGVSTMSAQRSSSHVVRSSLGDGIVKSEEGPLTKLTLTSASGASAEIFTLGATVTSFKAPSEVLFVRPDAKFDGSKPISGGLPFCWPQFGPGEIQQHGFARNCDWKVASTTGGASPSVTMELTPSDYTKEMWDYDFKNTYVITVGDDNKLKTTFKVENTGSKEFSFTGAIHSYFNVGDIDKTAVQGPKFKGATIFDRMLDPPGRVTEEREEVTVDKETDRCYEGVNGVVKIADTANSRTIVVDNKAGYIDTCVWSPYGNEGMGAKNFICVESGNVKDKVTVAPGATWSGELTLGLE